MAYIDTTDRIDHDQLQRQRVWALVDSIEDKLGLMMHEMDDLKDTLKRYQEGYIKPITFINILNKYIDELNND
jgi:hypothetical protein